MFLSSSIPRRRAMARCDVPRWSSSCPASAPPWSGRCSHASLAVSGSDERRPATKQVKYHCHLWNVNVIFSIWDTNACPVCRFLSRRIFEFINMLIKVYFIHCIWISLLLVSQWQCISSFVFYVFVTLGHNLTVVMGDRLSFIINHRLESVYEFICDVANYNRFTHIHRIKYFLCPKGNSGASGYLNKTGFFTWFYKEIL